MTTNPDQPEQVTAEQAYLAAYEYLLRRWEKLPDRLLASELSDMALTADGGSADPACMTEFRAALQAVLADEAASGRYTRADQRLD
jgi:hypothetical protein